MDIGDIEVFIGIDVGKSEHWATALSRDGQKVLDKALPNDEDRLREVYQRLQAKGQVLVVVDQPATIGALAVAVAQDMGITVGYLPGLSMRRIADLTPGSAKTDAKDAAVIAQAARTMPHTLRAVSTSDEDAAALSMLTGFDLDLARQVNQTANRIRGLYTQIHPALEAVVGPWLEHDAVLEVIAAWPTPADLKRAGKARIDARLKKHGCRRHAAWAGQIVSALKHQTVVVAGTDAAAVVLPHLARQLIALHAQRADVAAQVETLVQAHPLYQVLTSMPGIRGPGRRRLPGRDPGQDLQAPAPSWPPTPGSLPSHAAPAHRSAASTSPTAATRGSSAPCSSPPSPHCAPTPSPGPTTSANETKANRLGPGRPRPGPPPHPDPARHDPQRRTLRPPTSHETTRSRLTHHIGAPPTHDYNLITHNT